MAEPSHKIMMATETADVAQVAMIEALRSIARGQEMMAKGLEGMQLEAKEQAKLLLDVRERVVRIEAAAVDKKLEHIWDELKEQRREIDVLTEDKNHRDGAFRFADTLRRWAPAVLALIGIAVLLLKQMGKI